VGSYREGTNGGGGWGKREKNTVSEKGYQRTDLMDNEKKNPTPRTSRGRDEVGRKHLGCSEHQEKETTYT